MEKEATVSKLAEVKAVEAETPDKKTDATDEEKPPDEENAFTAVSEEKVNSRKRKTTSSKSEESASEESMSETKELEPQAKSPDKGNSCSMEGNLTVPSVDETLGKGKRARIPNKRYSDILLSPQPRHKAPSSIENGDKNKTDKTESENDATDEELTTMPNAVPLKPRSTTSSPALKRQRTTIDVNDPKYLKPFELGWKRELVVRATPDAKTAGDIYYYTPSGKKLKSMREISENLKGKELTLDNFAFFKEPLGLNDPEKEIVREAKLFNRKSAVSRTPKVMSPKLASPRTGSMKNSGSLKVKLPPSRTKSDRKFQSEEDHDETPKRGATKKQATKSSRAAEPPKQKRRTGDTPDEARSMANYLQNLSYGYSTLLYVFHYLKVQDLLRAGCVCTMWRDIASHPSLWRTVRMKNSQVHSFEGLANSLASHGTVYLDLRKMLLPTSGGDIWAEFSRVIKRVPSLQKIELCRCPASVVEHLFVTNPNLQVINALAIKCETMNLAGLAPLKNLKELRLKSTSGLSLTSDITSLSELTQLTHLSLTSIKDLNKMTLTTISSLQNLESLDLGECTDFPGTFGPEVLMKLQKLEKLRLEKGQGSCHTFELLETVKEMPKLEQLELVNFDIKPGFDDALGGCKNVKKLLIIPTYICQSATTNHMVLGGILKLKDTLAHFVWGVTLELLRVTELFVDQCKDGEKKKEKKSSGNGDSIPVLKPIPLLKENEEADVPVQDPPQVEILPLPSLQKLMLDSLPATRVKILKIPFHATWRQSITDAVN